MKVLLLQNIKNVGKILDEVSVKRGFGRYLINYKKAVYATKENLLLVTKHQDELEKKQNEVIQEAHYLAKSLEKVELQFIRLTQDDGKLFGSITKQDIIKELKLYAEKEAITLKKLQWTAEMVKMSRAIKVEGIEKVLINTHASVPNVEIIVNVANSIEHAKANIKKFIEKQQKSTSNQKQHHTQESKNG